MSNKELQAERTKVILNILGESCLIFSPFSESNTSSEDVGSSYFIAYDKDKFEHRFLFLEDSLSIKWTDYEKTA